jgi:hypothetical protein
MSFSLLILEIQLSSISYLAAALNPYGTINTRLAVVRLYICITDIISEIPLGNICTLMEKIEREY